MKNEEREEKDLGRKEVNGEIEEEYGKYEWIF